jgi:hypothetical protein
MSDTATGENTQVVDGLTKQEVRDAARARNPHTGTPGVDEPQRIKNQVDRAREAEGDPPTSSLAPQEETEDNIAEAREEQFHAWLEPQSEAEEKPEGPPLVHAADEQPGGRLTDDDPVGELVEDGLNDTGVDTGTLGKERAEAADERLEERAKAAEEALASRQGENTGVTGNE